MTFARLTVVYDLQPSEIWDGMPLAMVEEYINKMPQIIAERKIEAASAASFPYLKQEDQQAMMDQWMREVNVDEVEHEAATPGMLKMMGMGVEHVV